MSLLGDGGIGSNHPELVAEGLCVTIRCASPDCNTPLMQMYGVGTVRMIQPCCACGRVTSINATHGGINVFLMPKTPGRKGK